MTQENQTILEGWERYFDEINSFLQDLDRQAGVANESYCEYAVERLEICANTMFQLIYQLQSRISNGVVDSHGSAVVSQYVMQLTELLECLRGLWHEWLGNSDHIPRQSLSQNHSPNLLYSSTPGRPKFIISKE